MNDLLKLIIDQYGSLSIENIENNKYISILEADSWENLLFRLIEFSQTLGT
ncbi:hypothetical protein [Commensalibacter papalotli (ex Botero et al. 2024)]|uniref:Uncharacterized protein n=1 Tax=Commensalibacter papalotli (ex Botero et al. 2024) TaxID=2972766 RepID=A0ABN8WBD4_9PROT|nr:hypothetical protein [Commensalibacter papalotli (ex Botero et al. 2024)]CAI3936993.1 unnamed protein product [Commensalibacter papalotli (ex Botero et al. 2024)]CAI3938623.1 unnamed protein product [Commensalibacter papalotli (ex Botero et al. 2024)]